MSARDLTGAPREIELAVLRGEIERDRADLLLQLQKEIARDPEEFERRRLPLTARRLCREIKRGPSEGGAE